MKPTDRQKMCSSCEGRIPLEATECPYCAAVQIDSKSASSMQTPLFKHQSLQDSLTSLYTPPYSNKNTNIPSFSETREMSKNKSEPFKEAHPEKTMASSSSGMPVIKEEGEETAKNGLTPILLLSLAANLLMLGLLQFFFSDDGILRLEWESNFWFVYCLASIPLLFFGLKKVKELK